MSHIPDHIKKQGGLPTARDTRNTNTRYDCCYCPRKSLLHTSYGIHLFKEHIEDIFDTNTDRGKINRKSISLKTYLDYPLLLELNTGDVHVCLGCSSIFKCQKKAVHHFSLKKPCVAVHKDNIYKLREDFPMDGKSPLRGGLENKGILIQLISKLLERVRAMEKGKKFPEPFDYKHYDRYHEKWNMELEEDYLREYWDDLDDDEKLIIEETHAPQESPPLPDSPPPLIEKPEVKEITPLPPNNDDILPLVVPKPPTQLQMLEELLKDPELDDLAKMVLKKQVASTAPKPPVKEEIKMTPWEELYYGNPDTPLPQLFVIAAQRGIAPDPRFNKGIVGDTKVKRIATPRK